MSQGCVLVVDDEPINLVLIESLLEDFYQVLSGESAEQALTICQSRSHEVDLVVSDILMPGMSGHELCRQLKSQPDTRAIPVILISSLNGEADERAALQAGASDLIAKPYSPDLLLARVQAHIRLRQLNRTLQTLPQP